jgi:hypothetical protein
VADMLAVRCPYCRAPAGVPCGIRGFGTWRSRPAAGPHKRRAKLAANVGAHADPALDGHFPRRGPCLVCGTAGLDQRHRVIDAIADQLAAGEFPEDVAAEFGVSCDAALAVWEWMLRWPRAWHA